ncbi:MAG: hypothetical protein ACRERC_25745 [Candidatus Binatia bacterium]
MLSDWNVSSSPRALVARLLRAAACSILLGINLTACGDDDQAADQWTMVWGDEFNGPVNTGVDRTKWMYDVGTGYPGGPRERSQ